MTSPELSNSNSISLLVVGNSDNRVTGTVTLVRIDGLILLVDAGDPWNGAEILTNLQKYNISKEDVTHVVVTHGHIDHCGNLSLFQNAYIIMDADIGMRVGGKAEYSTIEHWPYQLSPSIKIHKYSGHTYSDLLVEVIVPNQQEEGNYEKYFICGDLVENEHDRGFENAVDAEKLQESQKFIFDNADFIIPGHGDIFRNQLKLH